MAEQEKKDPATIPPWSGDDAKYAPEVDVQASMKDGIKFRARNMRKLDYVFILASAAFIYIFYLHMMDTKAATDKQMELNKEVAVSLRYFACLIAIDQADRMAEFRNPNGICTKIGRF